MIPRRVVEMLNLLLPLLSSFWFVGRRFSFRCWAASNRDNNFTYLLNVHYALAMRFQSILLCRTGAKAALLCYRWNRDLFLTLPPACFVKNPSDKQRITMMENRRSRSQREPLEEVNCQPQQQPPAKRCAPPSRCLRKLCWTHTLSLLPGAVACWLSWLRKCSTDSRLSY